MSGITLTPLIVLRPTTPGPCSLPCVPIVTSRSPQRTKRCRQEEEDAGVPAKRGRCESVSERPDSTSHAALTGALDGGWQALGDQGVQDATGTTSYAYTSLTMTTDTHLAKDMSLFSSDQPPKVCLSARSFSGPPLPAMTPTQCSLQCEGATFNANSKRSLEHAVDPFAIADLPESIMFQSMPSRKLYKKRFERGPSAMRRDMFLKRADKGFTVESSAPPLYDRDVKKAEPRGTPRGGRTDTRRILVPPYNPFLYDILGTGHKALALYDNQYCPNTIVLGGCTPKSLERVTDPREKMLGATFTVRVRSSGALVGLTADPDAGDYLKAHRAVAGMLGKNSPPNWTTVDLVNGAFVVPVPAPLPTPLPTSLPTPVPAPLLAPALPVSPASPSNSSVDSVLAGLLVDGDDGDDDDSELESVDIPDMFPEGAEVEADLFNGSLQQSEDWDWSNPGMDDSVLEEICGTDELLSEHAPNALFGDDDFEKANW